MNSNIMQPEHSTNMRRNPIDLRGRFLSVMCSISLFVLLGSGNAVAGGNAAENALEAQVNGLWMYTGLTTKDGTEMPLTGVFLFKDGFFLQQGIFNSEPFESAGSMAHAGPTRPEPATGSMHMTANQTISIDPTASPALSFRPDTEHDVTVTREGNELTLIFGMGTSTVQTFEWAGPGEGDVYTLENGALALVDGHFILVDGDENSLTTGYGTYSADGENLTLQVIRWAEADESGAKNLRDVSLQASFDGAALTLADGRSFKVVK